MKAGHIFTIEPMINLGTWHDITWPDNWTSSTAVTLSLLFVTTLVVVTSKLLLNVGYYPLRVIILLSHGCVTSIPFVCTLTILLGWSPKCPV